MASLLDLPTELLVEVLSFVQHKPSLLNLSLVSSTLRKLAEPFLYQSFKNSRPGSSASFLGTIIRRPALSSYVRIAEFELSCSCCGDHASRRYLPMEDFVLFRDTLSRFQLEMPELQLFCDGDSDVEDDIIILLMLLLPRLEELQFGFAEESKLLSLFDNDLVFSTIRSQILANLRTLRKLRVWFAGFLGSFDVDLLPWLHLPLLGNFAGDEIRVISAVNGFPGMSNITSLSLHNSILDRDVAIAVLSACKFLKSFTYTWGPDGGLEQAVPAEITDALRTHVSPTLEHLKYIYHTGAWQEDMGEWREQFLMGSLSGFEKLATLEVNQVALLGPSTFAEAHPDSVPRLIDLLPPTLASFTIRFCGWHIMGQLLELAIMCQGLLCGLTSVTVIHGGFIHDMELFGLVADTFTANGVEFYC